MNRFPLPLWRLACAAALALGLSASVQAITWSYPQVFNSNAATDNAQDHLGSLGRSSSAPASDGKGNWVAVWQAGMSSPANVLVSRSSDNGTSWTPAVALFAEPTNPAAQNVAPQVATDRQGLWVAVWATSDTLSQTKGEDYDIVFSRSTDNGASWTPPALLHSSGTTDDVIDFAPQIVFDGRGSWIAAWRSTSTAAAGVSSEYDWWFVRSTDATQSWSQPALLDPQAAGDGLADYALCLASDGQGRVGAVWSRGSETSSTVLLSRLNDSGQSWSVPLALDGQLLNSGVFYVSTSFAASPTGIWMACWTDSSTQQVQLARSADRGASWSAPQLMGKGSLSSWISTNGRGLWMACWAPSNMSWRNAPIYSVSTDDGQCWNDSTCLAPIGWIRRVICRQAAVITSDGNSTWHALWHYTGASGDALGSDGDLLFSRVDSPSFEEYAWSEPEVLHTLTPSQTTPPTPEVMGDSLGNWVCTWRWEDDIYVSRRDASHGAWSSAQKLHAGDALPHNADERPRLACDGRGAFLVVWSGDDSSTLGPGIFYASSLDGGRTWSAPMVFAQAGSWSTAGFSPAVASNGNGGWALAWLRGEYQMSVARYVLFSVSNDNATSWSEPKALATLQQEAAYFAPAVAGAPDGNWICAWQSGVYYSGSATPPSHIEYAYSTDGGVNWSAKAQILPSEAGATLEKPALLRDGEESWLMSLHEQPYVSSSQLIQLRVLTSTDSGATWSDAGVIEPNSPRSVIIDSPASLATNGQGKWMAAWWSWVEGLGFDVWGVPDADVMLACSDSAGALWTRRVGLNSQAMSDTAYDYYPSLVCNRAGEWMAVWSTMSFDGSQRNIVFSTYQEPATSAAGDWQIYE